MSTPDKPATALATREALVEVVVVADPTLLTVWSIPGTRFNRDSGLGGRVLRYDDADQAAEAMVPPGATWAVVQDIADDLVRMSGDRHHIFIEGFEPDPADPNVVKLITGS